MLKYALALSFVLLGATIAYIRLMPVSVARYHVDLTSSERPDRKGHILIRQGGDTAPQSFDLARADLTDRIARVTLATPRTVRLAGDLNRSYASYVTRSGFWGFPDVASVMIVDMGDGTAQVVILSRQIYGIEDLGVNTARITQWLDQL